MEVPAAMVMPGVVPRTVPVDDGIGPPPALIRFFFTDASLATKYPKGVAVPLGFNRAHIPNTLRGLCFGNCAGTCYPNASEASKPDVLGVDLDAILQFVEDDTWSAKSGGRTLKSHGYVVVSVRHTCDH